MKREFLILVMVTWFASMAFISGSETVKPGSSLYRTPSSGVNVQIIQTRTDDNFEGVRKRILQLGSDNDSQGLNLLSDSLHTIIRLPDTDSSLKADLFYYSGVCELLASRHRSALRDLEMSITLKKNLGIIDEIFANALFNAGTASSYLGDYYQVTQYMKEYASLAGVLFSRDGNEIIEAYSALATASMELPDYTGFVDYSLKALGILKSGNATLTPENLSRLYSTIGAGYARTGDYAKARIYLENAEAVIQGNNLPFDEAYINLINSLAFTYGYLGLSGKANEYLSKGIDLAVNNNSALAFNLIHTQAVSLGRSGKTDEGNDLLASVLRRARQVYGPDSRLFLQQLKNYAGYLAYFSADPAKALIEYAPLMDYLEKNSEDVEMRNQVFLGYSRALYRTGDYVKALSLISEMLAGESSGKKPEGFHPNPHIDSLSADRSSLNILRLKYDILQALYASNGDLAVLKACAATSDLIISLIDKLRTSISEEESRIVLGDNYREAYLLAIRDFELCYRRTGEEIYLGKAFEFAEKSKVAGLLAATRQLKAIQFHIPQDLASMENSFQRMIGFYGSRISSENEKEVPDTSLMRHWNARLLSAITGRDSLLSIFERDYPGYFGLKYDNRVPSVEEIPAITGRNSNYINYVLSDSMLYIFLVNRKHSKIVAARTDSSFMKNLGDFRTLLSDPSHAESARVKFEKYQQVGYDLYRMLVEPVKEYFISGNLLISPDNILSYLPFETFLTRRYGGSDILYRNLSYLMNEYNISYAYSATFMNENITRKSAAPRHLAAFAPAYLMSHRYDTIPGFRNSENSIRDLPYARQEAEYAASSAKGVVFMNDQATETLFKSEAGEYSLIHLAMHALVDDQNPMSSAMLFSSHNDSLNDGLFHTYEVYGTPLQAKMVILSSCNTGSGVLSTGEGILSLARGFLYSGAQSVVMSLWKVDDKAGTDIVKLFYDNLRTGMSKSKALRKARHSYLKNANQLKSHPYFWSTLVIFGDNSPVFARANLIIIAILSAAAVFSVLLIFYFRRP